MVIKRTETPSAVRRRLSQTLNAGAITTQRRTSILADHPTLVGEPARAGDAEDGKDAEAAAPSPREGLRRASIKSRRASALSRHLAPSSTSTRFRDERILPALIGAAILLADPRPDATAPRGVPAERLLTHPALPLRGFATTGPGGSCGSRRRGGEADMGRHLVHPEGKGKFGEEEIEKLVNDAHNTVPLGEGVPK